MSFSRILERFVVERPVAVMYRALLERVLSAERLNQLFEQTAQEQYDHRIAFATLVDILGAVVTQQQKAVHTAYQACGGKDTVGASVTALYQKLAKVEPAVCQRVVQETTADLAALHSRLPQRRRLLPGVELRILDGKQLNGTDHRLAETRRRREAVLPGKLCSILDPDRELVLGVALTEDAHANERTLLDRLLDQLEDRVCVVADRNFCTKGFLLRLAAKGLWFIIRQHAGDCPTEALSRLQRLGWSGTGLVFEEQARIVTADGQTLAVRRLTLRLKKPTRDGDREIHVLTNLPAKFDGRRLVEVYRYRWRIEQAFQTLAEALRGEVNTLGYPRAALFGYCLALLAHNLLSTIKALVHAAQPAAAETKLSSYYLADEVTRAWDGLDLLIPPAHWEREFVAIRLTEFIRKLKRIAQHVNVSRFATRTRGPKKPRRQLPRGKSTHLSTFRLLSASRPARK